MLFLTYWELNEKMSLEQRLEIAQKLTSSGLFPPENVKILRWDITPDGWGITICKADNAADVAKAFNMWRAAGTGFFNVTKTSPATPVEESMPDAAELLKTLRSA